MDASIIITSYNYEKYIEKTIKSCLNQDTEYSFEIIIVDDGSTDRTSRILESYSGSCRIFSMQNCGVEKASNFGIRKSEGEFIVRLDADDLLNTNYLQNTISYMKVFANDFLYTNYHDIDENGNVVKTSDLPVFNVNEIFLRGDFLASGTLYNKSSFIESGGYNEDYKNCGLENYELILKMISERKKGILLEEILFKYRRHSTNMSHLRKESIISYGKSLFKRNNYGEFKSNEYHPYSLKF